MTRRKSKPLWTGALLALLVAGCAGPGTGSGKKTGIGVAIEPSSVGALAHPRVRQEDHQVLISGKVRSLHEFLLPGHVDIAVLDRDGNTLLTTRAAISNYASKKGGMKEARFFNRLHLDLPPGARISLRYHAPGECPEAQKDS